MVKRIESYPELADPQLQPRYSGIPTFFRLPHTMRLDNVDIGQARLGAVERLDLRLLVERQHDGVGRRIDVPYRLDPRPPLRFWLLAGGS